jgi:hypothetical protein
MRTTLFSKKQYLKKKLCYDVANTDSHRNKHKHAQTPCAVIAIPLPSIAVQVPVTALPTWPILRHCRAVFTERCVTSADKIIVV